MKRGVSSNQEFIDELKEVGSSSALLKDQSNDGSDNSEGVGRTLEIWAFTAVLASEPSLLIL